MKIPVAYSNKKKIDLPTKNLSLKDYSIRSQFPINCPSLSATITFLISCSAF